MEDNIFKIWGERRRILLTVRTEIDLLYLKKNCFCSLHTHKDKINKFCVIKGAIKIETDYGTAVLKKNDNFTVFPPRKHRFVAIKDSIMIELAFVNKGKIDPNDIQREKQGGRIIKGKEKTLEEMVKEGLLDL